MNQALRRSAALVRCPRQFPRPFTRHNGAPHLRHVIACSRREGQSEEPRRLPGVSWGLVYNEHEQHPSGAAGPHADPLAPYRTADAILVLAGGQTGPDSLPTWVERRLDAAHDLHLVSGAPIVCLGGGTPHKPNPLDAGGFVVHESTACTQYLMRARGMRPQDMLKEVSSYDTVGNAYFSLTIHALPMAWRKVVVITSDFHMSRTASLFSHMYRLAGQDLFNDPNRFELLYVAATDDGLFEPEVLAARKDKEDASRRSWLRTAAGLASLKQLHSWLFQTHLCYAVPRQHEFGVQTIKDAKLLASY